MEASFAEPTVFLGDIHGDATALRTSLLRSGTAARTRTGVRMLDDWNVVSLGDLTDRGNQNLRVLDMLLDIRGQIGDRLKLCAGNHDIGLLQALRHPETVVDVDSWLQTLRGYTVLREIAKTRKLLLRKPVTDAYPVPLTDKTEFVLDDWEHLVTKHRMERYDFPKAYETAQEIFLQSPARHLYEDMRIYQQIGTSILAVHAGVSNAVQPVEDFDAVNARFCAHRDAGEYTGMLYGSDRTILDATRMREYHQPNRELFTHHTARQLLERGIRVVIRGHEISPIAQPFLVNQNEIGTIWADSGMSHGVRTGNRWGWVRADQDGDLLGQSMFTAGIARFGRIINGTFVPYSVLKNAAKEKDRIADKCGRMLAMQALRFDK